MIIKLKFYPLLILTSIITSCYGQNQKKSSAGEPNVVAGEQFIAKEPQMIVSISE